jgi:hypothetical protein
MAAPKYTDRLKAQELRSLSIEAMIEVIKGKPSDFKNQLLLRLAGSVLPRLNENTGEDGGPMIIQVAKEGAEKYGLNPTQSPSDNTIGQTQV